MNGAALDILVKLRTIHKMWRTVSEIREAMRFRVTP
jgi:hypothetical protein